MKVECSHCHKFLEINLQFLVKDRIEIECSHCHESILVEAKSKQKQELQDTHPFIKESEAKPKSTSFLNPSLSTQSNLSYWKLVTPALFFLAIAPFLLKRIWPSKPMPVASQNSAIWRSSDAAVPSIASSIPVSEDTSAKSPPLKQRGERKSADTTFLLSEIDRVYATFSPMELNQLKAKVLAGLKSGKESIAEGAAVKLAVIFAYLSFKEQNEAYASVAEQFASIYHVNTNNADYNLMQAIVKAQKGDFEQSMKFSEKSLSLNPKNKLTSAYMAYAQARLKNASGLEQLKTLYQTHWFYPAGFLLFQAYLGLDQKQDAVTISRNLLRVEPEDTPIKKRLAEIFFEQSQWKESLVLYQGLVSRYPDNAEYKLNIARILRKQGRLPESKRVLDFLLQATNMNIAKPVQMGIQLERGMIDYDMKKYADAVRYFEVAHQLDPNDFPALKLLSESLIKSGRIKTALQILEFSKEKNPTNKDLLQYLLTTYQDGKNLTMAEKTIQDMLKSGLDKDPKVYFELGKLKETQGDKTAALDAYQKANKLDPSFVPAKQKVLELTPSPLPSSVSQ